MRRTLAVLAMTLVPFTAEAVEFQVKNCYAESITVAAIQIGRENVDTQASIPTKQSAAVKCLTDDCWLKVMYVVGTQGVFAEYRNPIRDDRCTRGPDDIPLGDLPIAGNCGC